MENKYLRLAREARAEDNSEDAKKYYDMVRTDDPTNGEAKFFYAYYALHEGKNGEIALRFENLCKVVAPSIARVADSELSQEEKIDIVGSITDAFVPSAWDLNRYMNNLTVGTGADRTRVLDTSHLISVCKNGIATNYALGDAIEKHFSGNKKAMEFACKAWKEGISLQQKWYAYGTKGDPEKYAAKVQKYDPSYEMPKKAGCITLADKKN